MPIRERYVWVCTNRRGDGHPKGSCAEKGSEALRDQLKKACAGAGLHETVRVCTSGCIDLCESGITVAVMPEDVLLAGVDGADVPALVAALASPGGVAAQPALVAKVLPRKARVEAP